MMNVCAAETADLTNAPNQKLPPEVYTTKARLPAVYETAKAALAECASIDECKGWSDKAAALASYAKQIDDSTLLKMATRIKARAVRRAGELLEQIKSQRGGDRRSDQSRGAPTLVRTRKDAARKAGLSKDQQVQATRIARIPEQDFEQAIEADKPPTVTQLAAQGTKPRPVVNLNGRDPREFNTAMHFVGDFENFVKVLNEKDIDGCCEILTDTERTDLRTAIEQIDAITDRIIGRL